jgi:hypothetical protein
MPATRNTQTGASGQPRPGRGRRPHSGAAPHGPPDVGALAREAVISFLQDASRATAEREAVRAGAAAPGAAATVTEAPGSAVGDGASIAEAILAGAPELDVMPVDAISAGSPVAAESEAWRLAAVSAAALDRIEAAAAKVEADIARAHRAYEELQAGAGAAAEAAVRAAESAMASAGTAVEAERQVKISLRQVRQNVVISFALVAIVIIVLLLVTSPVR